ncbi:MAG: hypothetical protein JW864_07480 [Spirochaetes bacterium]|nr:hypothetical protein [Spirochaetota bacterium]
MKRNYNNITGHGNRYNLNNNSKTGNISVLNSFHSGKIIPENRQTLNAYSSYILIDSNTGSELHSSISNTDVCKLTKSILQNTDSHYLWSNSKKIFNNNFYSLCIEELADSERFSKNYDIELLLLFLKQLAMILRETDRLIETGRKLKENRFLFFSFKLYRNLLDSFWNKTSWEKIFPSMPEFAMYLHDRRNLIIDLIFRNGKTKFRIDKLCESFLESSGFGEINDIYLISFIDFYLLTWLSHFGLIKYLNGNDYEPVKIEVTNFARAVINYLPL